ncbi:hypothetical protein [Geomicrobium sp. JCM 19055]|uniref:hypothetical protein n=1 Tax=Geomicrobium sp. JCM 19055 TaxID=1460649 RepID=UPI00045ED6F7|nr:hypothetical protein [Geomicrobium sp. JCM 19055]GAJ99141.1 hypothetical protein JCM19055_2128 [Geomicrobium sp. JCM 19055]
MPPFDDKSFGYSARDYYGTIEEILHTIKDHYLDFTEVWINDLKDKGNKPYNLKKKQVSHMVSIMDSYDQYEFNNNFIEILNDYNEFLTFLTIYDLDYLEDEYSHLDLRMRVKEPQSYVSKLLHYRINKNELGKIPLNKCLNDLLGLRLIVPGFNYNCPEFKGLFESIQNRFKEKGYRVKLNHQCVGDYEAIHIYFDGENNAHFPWELQIWSKEQAKINYDSHALHKQAYTEWAGVYKDIQTSERKGGE